MWVSHASRRAGKTSAGLFAALLARTQPIVRLWLHQVTPEQLNLGMLLPPQSNMLEVEIQTAARVAKLVFDSGLARVERPTDMVSFIRRHVYKPEYPAEAAAKAG